MRGVKTLALRGTESITWQASNHAKVGQGFQFLLEVFAPYVAKELGNIVGNDWWDMAVLGALRELV